MGGAWTRDQFRAMITRFPEGALHRGQGACGGRAFSLVIDYSRFGDRHTYQEVVGDGTLKNHDPEGDYLYGIDIFVSPDYREKRLGRRLYDARKELCETLNLKGIVIGGRIPGYAEWAEKKTPQQYIRMVNNREISDPVLTFQVSNDFHYKKMVENYWPEDYSSKGYGVIMEWNNIYYEERKRLISKVKTYMRLGVVQWQMRSFESFDDFLQQVEFFVDTQAGYNTDLMLFPELFNALCWPSSTRKTGGGHAVPAGIRRNSGRAWWRWRCPTTSTSCRGACRSCGTTGSTTFPFSVDATAPGTSSTSSTSPPTSTGTGASREGTISGSSRRTWGRWASSYATTLNSPTSPGTWPSRAWTSCSSLLDGTKNAYLRVRRCAQSRAIENECYVAIAGSVGNIPKVENMDIQYAQSAIFTPSDFAFPHDAVAAEATPNTEMALIADLDVELLKELRLQGSVRNLSSRRTDLYWIDWLKEKEREEEE